MRIHGRDIDSDPGWDGIEKCLAPKLDVKQVRAILKEKRDRLALEMANKKKTQKPGRRKGDPKTVAKATKPQHENNGQSNLEPSRSSGSRGPTQSKLSFYPRGDVRTLVLQRTRDIFSTDDEKKTFGNYV